MTEMTPDNAARATPVAWVSADELVKVTRDGDDRGILAPKRTPRGSRTVPLYSAATVAALEAEVREQSGWADKWKALHDAVSLAHEVQAKSLVRATERAEAAEKALDRVVRWCDGVMNHPMIGWNPELHETAKKVKALTGARAK